eukprot:m.119718 g.119718  ORF g.119718 m.119718 type:complete len:1619 (+) comp9360_c0_seq8:344-5200(+)
MFGESGRRLRVHLAQPSSTSTSTTAVLLERLDAGEDEKALFLTALDHFEVCQPQLDTLKVNFRRVTDAFGCLGIIRSYEERVCCVAVVTGCIPIARIGVHRIYKITNVELIVLEDGPKDAVVTKHVTRTTTSIQRFPEDVSEQVKRRSVLERVKLHHMTVDDALASFLSNYKTKSHEGTALEDVRSFLITGSFIFSPTLDISSPVLGSNNKIKCGLFDWGAPWRDFLQENDCGVPYFCPFTRGNAEMGGADSQSGKVVRHSVWRHNHGALSCNRYPYPIIQMEQFTFEGMLLSSFSHFYLPQSLSFSRATLKVDFGNKMSMNHLVDAIHSILGSIHTSQQHINCDIHLSEKSPMIHPEDGIVSEGCVGNTHDGDDGFSKDGENSRLLFTVKETLMQSNEEGTVNVAVFTSLSSSLQRCISYSVADLMSGEITCFQEQVPVHLYDNDSSSTLPSSSTVRNDSFSSLIDDSIVDDVLFALNQHLPRQYLLCQITHSDEEKRRATLQNLPLEDSIDSAELKRSSFLSLLPNHNDETKLQLPSLFTQSLFSTNHHHHHHRHLNVSPHRFHLSGNNKFDAKSGISTSMFKEFVLGPPPHHIHQLAFASALHPWLFSSNLSYAYWPQLSAYVQTMSERMKEVVEVVDLQVGTVCIDLFETISGVDTFLHNLTALSRSTHDVLILSLTTPSALNHDAILNQVVSTLSSFQLGWRTTNENMSTIVMERARTLIHLNSVFFHDKHNHCIALWFEGVAFKSTICVLNCYFKKDVVRSISSAISRLEHIYPYHFDKLLIFGNFETQISLPVQHTYDAIDTLARDKDGLEMLASCDLLVQAIEYKHLSLPALVEAHLSGLKLRNGRWNHRMFVSSSLSQIAHDNLEYNDVHSGEIVECSFVLKVELPGRLGNMKEDLYASLGPLFVCARVPTVEDPESIVSAIEEKVGLVEDAICVGGVTYLFFSFPKESLLLASTHATLATILDVPVYEVQLFTTKYQVSTSSSVSGPTVPPRRAKKKKAKQQTSKRSASINAIDGWPESLWLTSSLGRVAADDILSKCGVDGCFLVRASSQTHSQSILNNDETSSTPPTQIFTISFISNGAIKHYRIKSGKDNKFVVKHRVFNSLADIVHSYRYDCIFGSTTLKYPVNALSQEAFLYRMQFFPLTEAVSVFSDSDLVERMLNLKHHSSDSHVSERSILENVHRGTLDVENAEKVLGECLSHSILIFDEMEDVFEDHDSSCDASQGRVEHADDNTSSSNLYEGIGEDFNEDKRIVGRGEKLKKWLIWRLRKKTRDAKGKPDDKPLLANKSSFDLDLVFLKKCFSWLYDHDCDKEEGIFRLSGSIKQVKVLYHSVHDEGLSVGEGVAWTTVTSSIKYHFRQIGASVFAEKEEVDLVRIFSSSRDDLLMCIDNIRPLVHAMAYDRKNVFKFVMENLLQICMFEKLNKMSKRNMAVVFGPSFFSAKDSLGQFSLIQVYNDLFQFFLENFDAIIAEDHVRHTVPMETNVTFNPLFAGDTLTDVHETVGAPVVEDVITTAAMHETVHTIDESKFHTSHESLFENVNGIHVAKVLYDYESHSSNELSVLEGDVVELEDVVGDNGWLYCTMHTGESGYVPFNYVKVQEGVIYRVIA